MLRVVFVLFLFFFSSGALHAQETPPEVNLSVYCRNDVTAAFRIGVDENYDIEFRATFDDKSPSEFLQLFFVDGNVENGKVNEQRITKMRCVSQGEDSGEICIGTISLERSEKLESKFNFDQSVINLSLRKGREGKDYCLGKFTNDPEKISRNSRVERIHCQFVPSDEESGLSGEGHFNPGGYGLEENAHFHMTLSGFEEEKVFYGCSVTGENRYRQAFTFQAYDPNSDDTLVYGALSQDEQDEFDSRKIDYSYDLYRTVTEDSDLDLNASFVPNLSQINFGISAPAASSARKKGNKKRARSRKRKKKKGTSRRRSLSVFDQGSLRAASRNSSVFQWLSFDPNDGGEIYVANNCKGDVASKAYGRIVCNDETLSDDRSCVAMTGDDDSVEAKGCKEPKGAYSLASVRVKGLAEGQYTVCLDTTAVSDKLTVTSDDSGTYGILEITDHVTLKAEMPALALFGGSFDAAETIGVSETGDCSTLILQGDFN